MLVSRARPSHVRWEGLHGDISIALAVSEEHTECNFCCVINLNSCICHFMNNSFCVFTSRIANINGAWNACDSPYTVI